jgi:hypothetical protein
MTVFNCSDEMAGYHSEWVTLSSANQQEMHDRREAGRTRLHGALQRKNFPLPFEIAVQGSYAMRTMIQDDENDYDIDDGVYFRATDLVDANGTLLTPRGVRDRICEALKSDQRLKHDAEVKSNCVRQEYPEGYHIDVAVYRVLPTNDGISSNRFELASGDRWIQSDARGVTKWFNAIVGELNREQSDGSQLRRIVKLTKKLCRSRKDWKLATTSGICLTVLVRDCFTPVEGRDDESLLRTLQNIHTRLSANLTIKHPVLGHYLADQWDPKVLFCRDCIRHALFALCTLDTETCTRKDARKAWDTAFGTNFFGAQPGGGVDGGGGGQRSIFIATDGVAQRNDGGRRFG